MNKDDVQQPEEEIVDESVDEEELEQESEIEALQLKVEEAENNYRRALADYQNLQKRTQEDRMQWIRSANKDLLLRILTVLDTLMLAHQHKEDKNIEVSIAQFLDVLKAEGVTKIETKGKKFDPHLMEAIATDEGEEGKVLEELRAGFMLHDSLLRAAQVKVGKK